MHHDCRRAYPQALPCAASRVTMRAMPARTCARIFVVNCVMIVAMIVVVALAGALPAVPVAAQGNKASQATAAQKMTPPGEGDAMRACNKLAMDRHVKMEERARFVQDCVAKKMKKK